MDFNNERLQNFVNSLDKDELNKRLQNAFEQQNHQFYEELDKPRQELQQMIEDIQGKAREEKQIKEKREIENNQNLKSILEENKNLVSLNNKLVNKMNSLDDTLKFLNIAFEDKAKIDKLTSEQRNALLLELITIIENKDPNKLNQFMNKIGLPVSVGLLIQYLKKQIGIQ